jgi:hypothetical protein
MADLFAAVPSVHQEQFLWIAGATALDIFDCFSSFGNEFSSP